MRTLHEHVPDQYTPNQSTRTDRQRFQSIVMADLSKTYRIESIDALQHDTAFRVVVTHPSSV